MEWSGMLPQTPRRNLRRRPDWLIQASKIGHWITLWLWTLLYVSLNNFNISCVSMQGLHPSEAVFGDWFRHNRNLRAPSNATNASFLPSETKAPSRPNLSQDSLLFSDEPFFKEVRMPTSDEMSNAWVSHFNSTEQLMVNMLKNQTTFKLSPFLVVRQQQ